MNLAEVVGPVSTVAFRAWRALTALVPAGQIRAFGDEAHQIGAILVINLDRQPKRWKLLRRELGRFRTSTGAQLSSITRRLAAVDARDGRASAATGDVDPMYRIGDQLYVQPDIRLSSSFGVDEPVKMTRQEVAVARSHIEVWKAVATGTSEFALVLEDDVWFKRGAKSAIDRGWRAAFERFADSGGPGLVYFSYEDAGGIALRVHESTHIFEPVRGLWFLSGYVLSREGAAALLRAMPVVGPVDLWINYQFASLNVAALNSPSIAQRPDAKSDNSYSVMPYLARAGIVDARHAAKPPSVNSRQVLAWTSGVGPEGLAMALSMLGLRVRAFDGHEDPLDQLQLSEALRIFDALVNVPLEVAALADVMANERTVFVVDVDARTPMGLIVEDLPRARSAVLTRGDLEGGSWNEICELLGLVAPVDAFPKGALPESRLFRDGRSLVADVDAKRDRRISPPIDDSPWVLPAAQRRTRPTGRGQETLASGQPIVEATMTQASPAFPALTETFPGNLASFAPESLEYGDEGVRIRIDISKGGPRPFQSGAFASVQSFTHGHFQAEIRAAAGAGLVTGFFLHRSMPRQEIDIEFAGNNPRRMLTNVFFNPGDDGAAMAYGYRGSPRWIDLGFDSTEEFHDYAIDWSPDRIIWSVDGNVVHERAGWDPTPIPHLSMQVHANLWAPRSRELAGDVAVVALPASALFRNMIVTSSATGDATPPAVERVELRRPLDRRNA